jgi:hypothetical protein
MVTPSPTLICLVLTLCAQTLVRRKAAVLSLVDRERGEKINRCQKPDSRVRQPLQLFQNFLLKRNRGSCCRSGMSVPV